MQIVKKTNLRALKKARALGSNGVIGLLGQKGLVGRGGAGFPTAKKWEFALTTKSDQKYVICNADEGEPGTFKDKFIIRKNPQTLIEGIIIAAEVVGAGQAYIYLRGEYEYLEKGLRAVMRDVLKRSGSNVKIDIIVGGGAYVCGDETAIIKSIEGFRGHPYYKPPFPPIEGLWGKPTVVNNVETLANVGQAILFDDWDSNLRLYSLSGNLTKPGLYELACGIKLSELIKIGKPSHKIKAIYFGCFGGCMPYKDILMTPENVCGLSCAIGSYTVIVVDETQSIPMVTQSIAQFYEHESCGKCTPCREGTVRILDLLTKINSGGASEDDLSTLKDLAEYIHETSLCGLGQTATNHVLTALKYFWDEFKNNLK